MCISENKRIICLRAPRNTFSVNHQLISSNARQFEYLIFVGKSFSLRNGNEIPWNLLLFLIIKMIMIIFSISFPETHTFFFFFTFACLFLRPFFRHLYIDMFRKTNSFNKHLLHYRGHTTYTIL